MIDGMAVGVVEDECDRSASAVDRTWTVDSGQGLAIGMADGDELVDKTSGHLLDVRMNRVDADRRQILETHLDGRQREIIRGAVLESRFAFGEVVLVALNGRHGNGAACKPGPTKGRECVTARE